MSPIAAVYYRSNGDVWASTLPGPAATVGAVAQKDRGERGPRETSGPAPALWITDELATLAALRPVAVTRPWPRGSNGRGYRAPSWATYLQKEAAGPSSPLTDTRGGPLLLSRVQCNHRAGALSVSRPHNGAHQRGFPMRPLLPTELGCDACADGLELDAILQPIPPGDELSAAPYSLRLPPMIQFNCPSCQATYRVPEEHQGAKTTCRGCRQPLVVPVVSSETPNEAIRPAVLPGAVTPTPPHMAAPAPTPLPASLAAALERVHDRARPPLDWLIRRPLVLLIGAGAFLGLGCLGLGGVVIAWGLWSNTKKAEIAQAGKAQTARQAAAAAERQPEPRPEVPPPKIDPAAKEADWVKLVRSAPPGPSATDRRREWLKQSLVDAYDRAGRKNPRWDSDARKLLALAASTWEERFNELSGMLTLYQAVTRAGCDDPLVLYVVGRVAGPSFAHDKVAQRMAGSTFHPVHRCLALARAAEWYAGHDNLPDRAGQAQRHLDDALKLLHEAALDKAVPIPVIVDVCRQLEEGFLGLDPDRKLAFDKIDAVLQKARPENSLVYTYRGHFYTTYAWDARGGGYANTVGQDRFRIFRERLGHAATALEKAWELDTTNSDAATQMITVEMGQGNGRRHMETWFHRAMATDPDNYSACQKKLLYLAPKWHGTINDPRKFGMECLATGNWKARLPLLLADAHESLAECNSGQPERYYRRSLVWEDVQPVFESYLRQFPQASFERSRYALWACRCVEWQEADRQFTILGDNAQKHLFGNADAFQRLREEAVRRAKEE